VLTVDSSQLTFLPTSKSDIGP